MRDVATIIFISFIFSIGIISISIYATDGPGGAIHKCDPDEPTSLTEWNLNDDTICSSNSVYEMERSADTNINGVKLESTNIGYEGISSLIQIVFDAKSGSNLTLKNGYFRTDGTISTPKRLKIILSGNGTISNFTFYNNLGVNPIINGSYNITNTTIDHSMYVYGPNPILFNTTKFQKSINFGSDDNSNAKDIALTTNATSFTSTVDVEGIGSYVFKNTNITSSISNLNLIRLTGSSLDISFDKARITNKLVIGLSSTRSNATVRGTVELGRYDAISSADLFLNRYFPLSITNRNGFPLKNQYIEIFDKNGNLVNSGTTDTNGFLESNITFNSSNSLDNFTIRIHSIDTLNISLNASSYNSTTGQENILVNFTGNCEDRDGNWEPTYNVTCLNENITIRGNLTINSGIVVKSINSNITFGTVAEGSAGVILKSGGTFNTTDNTRLNSNSTFKYRLDFQRDGSFNLDNTTISRGSGNITGNITVDSGKYLILNQTTIRMNPSTDGEFKIDSSGNLTILSGSNITRAGGANYDFWIREGSNFTLRDSYISYVGWDGTSSSRGLRITGTNGAIIHNNTIETNGPNARAIWLEDSNNTNVSNNILTASGSQGYGIRHLRSRGVNVINNSIDSTYYGVYLSGSIEILSRNTNFSNNNITADEVGIEFGANAQSNDIVDNEITVPTGKYLVKSNEDGTSINNHMKITKQISYRNGSISSSGNLTIESSGNLTLNNVTLKTVSSSPVYKIDSSGILVINGSNITSNGVAFDFFSRSGSTLHINDSSLSYLGGNGLEVSTSNFQFNRNNITDSSNGMKLIGVTNINITESEFSTTTRDVNATDGSNVGLVDTVFDRQRSTYLSSQLTVYWTAEAFTRTHPDVRPQGVVSGVGVAVEDGLGNSLGSYTTGGDGSSVEFMLREYNENDGIRTNYNNHTFTTTATGYKTKTYSENITGIRTGTNNITLLLEEDVDPKYYNNFTNFQSGDDYSRTKMYEFSINWTDENSSIDIVKIEHNFNGTLWNYTVSRIDGDQYSGIYNYTYGSLAAGTYLYTWYANDAFGNSNATHQIEFTVDKAVPVLHITPNQTVVYPTETVVQGNVSEGDTAAVTRLLRNGTSVGTGGLNRTDTATLAAGFYNYTFQYDETENYTSGFNQSNVTIEKGPTSMVLKLNGTEGNRIGESSYNKGDLANLSAYVNVSGKDLNIYGNWSSADLLTTRIGDVEENLTDTGLRALGMYNITANWTGDENYTSSSINYLLEVNDTEKPVCTDNRTNPLSGVTYREGPGIEYQFNITCTDNDVVDIVILEFDGRNYTVATRNGDEYYHTITDLAANEVGYDYRWYVNDTRNNLNSTEVLNYKVMKAPVNIDIYLNETGPNVDRTITYPSGANATAVIDIDTNQRYGFRILRNGTCVAGSCDGTSNTDKVIEYTGSLAANYYNFTAYYPESENYSSFTRTNFLTVNKGTTVLHLKLNGTEGNNDNYVYPDTINATSYADQNGGTIRIYNNVSGIMRLVEEAPELVEDLSSPAAGAYNYTAELDHQNYTANNVSYLATIKKGTPSLQHDITPNSGTYPVETAYSANVTGGDASADTKVTLDEVVIHGPSNPPLNKTDTRTLSAGTHTYNFTYDETQNYTSYTINLTVTISKASANDYLKLYLESQESDVTVTYPEETNATGIFTGSGAGDLNLKLYRNDTGEVDSGSPAEDITTLSGSSVYNYTYNTSGGANYTAGSVSRLLTVNPASTYINLTLNGTEGPMTYNKGEIANISALLNITELKDVRIYNNDTGELVTTGTNPKQNMTNTSTLSLGAYNITANWTGDENYTKTSSSHILTITDTEAPRIISNVTDPLSPTVYAPGKTYQFNATVTDNDAVDTVLLEFNGVNYTATRTGNEYNVTFKDLAARPSGYGYRWYANDSSGNTVSTDQYTYIIEKSVSGIDLYIDDQKNVNVTNEYTETPTNVTSILNRTSQYGTFRLFRNDTEINTTGSSNYLENLQHLAVGVYRFKANVTETENYTSGNTVFYLTVTKAEITLHLYLNGTADNKTYVYPDTINATVDVDVNDGTFTLTRNGTSMELESLGNNMWQNITSPNAGYYEYRAEFEHENYTANPVTFYANLKKKPASIALTLNGSAGPRTYEKGDLANISALLNVSLESGSLKLYANYTGSMQELDVAGQNPIENITNTSHLSIGSYKIVANYTGTENIESASNDTILTVDDTQNPVVTLQLPENNTWYSTVPRFDCRYSDNDIVSTVELYGIQDGVWKVLATRSPGQSSGTESFNGIDMDDGSNPWNCEATDAAGNDAMASQNNTVNIDTTAPAYSQVSQSADEINAGDSITLKAYWTDAMSNVSFAILSTNESGVWVNHTSDYSSPMNLSNQTSANWSNFTWSNSSVPGGTTIGWRIYANDTWGNLNSTDINSFYVRVSTAPAEPTNVKAMFNDSINHTTLLINWTDNSNGENEFYVERSFNGGAYELVNTTATRTSSGTGENYSYVDTGLEANRNYSYRVYAGNAQGNSSKVVAENADVSSQFYKYTRAEIPDRPDATSEPNSIRVKIKPRTNPEYTEYYIAATNGKYVAQDNSLTSDTPVWKSYVDWGGANGISVTGVDQGTTYCFNSTARNDDSINTDSGSLSCSTPGQGSGPSTFTVHFDPARVDIPVSGSLIQHLFIKNTGTEDDTYDITVKNERGTNVIGSIPSITVEAGGIDRVTFEVELTQGGSGTLEVDVVSSNDPNAVETATLTLDQSTLGVPGLSAIGMAVLTVLSAIAIAFI